MKTLYPKCLDEDREFGNSSRGGYLLPCCWTDIPNLFESDFKDLVKNKFKISEVNSIEEIIESEEWVSFYNNLKNNIAPEYCYQICGKKRKMFGIK